MPDTKAWAAEQQREAANEPKRMEVETSTKKPEGGTSGKENPITIIDNAEKAHPSVSVAPIHGAVNLTTINPTTINSPGSLPDSTPIAVSPVTAPCQTENDTTSDKTENDTTSDETGTGPTDEVVADRAMESRYQAYLDKTTAKESAEKMKDVSAIVIRQKRKERTQLAVAAKKARKADEKAKTKAGSKATKAKSKAKPKEKAKAKAAAGMAAAIGVTEAPKDASLPACGCGCYVKDYKQLESSYFGHYCYWLEKVKCGGFDAEMKPCDYVQTFVKGSKLSGSSLYYCSSTTLDDGPGDGCAIYCVGCWTGKIGTGRRKRAPSRRATESGF